MNNCFRKRERERERERREKVIRHYLTFVISFKNSIRIQNSFFVFRFQQYTNVYVCACVYVRTYMTMFLHTCTVHGCMHEEVRDQPQVLFFWCSMHIGFFFFLRQCLSLAWSSASRLSWHGRSALLSQLCDYKYVHLHPMILHEFGGLTSETHLV